MIKKLIDRIFSNSKIFNIFRNIIHNNFQDEKKIIRGNFESDKTTLDFGCGAGQFSVLFNGNKYYGLDTDKNYIKFCKKNMKGNFYLIKETPPYDLNKNSFDQMLISAVVHHIDNDGLSKISLELNRLLKKNAKLMIIDHFRLNKQINPIAKLLTRLDRGNYFRNPEEVIEIFSKSFKVKKILNFKNGPYNDYMLIFNPVKKL